MYRVRGSFPPWPYRLRRPPHLSVTVAPDPEPCVGSRVSGVMEITGEPVQGEYLGSYSWSASLRRCTLANLRVDDARRVVAVRFDSVEPVCEGVDRDYSVG